MDANERAEFVNSLTNCNSIIRSSSLVKFPEEIKRESNEKVIVKNPEVIITEMPFESSITVAVKATLEKRTWTKEDNGQFNICRKHEQVGDFKTLPDTATFKEVLEAINAVVDNIIKSI